MRVRYRADVQFTDSPKAEDVADEIWQWIDEKVQFAKRPKGTVAFPATTFPEDLAVEADRTSSLWGARFSHADATDPNVKWSVELVLSVDRDQARTFSCAMSVGNIDGSVVPPRRRPSRPRIVLNIMRRWATKRGLPLTASAWSVDNEDIEKLARDITSAERMRPLVLVSARAATDRPLIDPGRLAESLAGTAHVVAAKSRFPMMKLRDILPTRFHCWDGAVRLFWPRAHAEDPRQHPYWSPREVAELDGERHQFKEHLLGWISEATAYSADPAIPSWPALEQQRRVDDRNALREKGDTDELLRLADDSLKQQDSTIAGLREQLSEVEEDLQRAIAAEKHWKDLYLSSFKEKDDEPEATTEAPAIPHATSVAEAIGLAKEAYKDRLVFALNGKSDPDTPFEDVEAVTKALNFLATTFYDARTGARLCGDLDKALRDVCGWKYEANQSKTTMNKYAEWYTTKDSGTKYFLKEHVGKGISKDPRITIRIGMAWDDARRLVIIGFVGQHQETDKS